MSKVLILSHDDVVSALPPADCADAMADVLAARARGGAHMPLRTVMAAPAAKGFMGLMPGWRAAADGVPEEFGLKTVCIVPDNRARGLDTHQGTVTLFDGETGVPTAILDASAITMIRTAAVTAVATRLLARPDARVLAIVGAGVQGRAHIEALAGLCSFEEIRVYSPTPARSRSLAEWAATRVRVPVTVASGARDAVRGADVVVTATSSSEPVLSREWLASGIHLNAVGASRPSAREIDVATVAAGALFCDSRESVLAEAGEFRLAIEQGAIGGADHIRAELGEVLIGAHPGRSDASELTLFRSLGVAVEDLAAARRAVDAAREQGLGIEAQL